MSALQGGGLDLNTPEGQARAFSIAPEAAGPLVKNMMEARQAQSTVRKNDSEAGKFDAETAAKHADFFRGQLANVTNPQQAQDWVRAQYADPVLGKLVGGMGPVENAVASIPTDPNGFQRWVQQNALGMAKFVELNKPQTTVVPAGGTSQVLQTPGLGGQPQLVGTVAHTTSPDAILQANTSRANNRDTIAKDYAINGLNPDGSQKTMPIAVDGSLDLSKVAPEDLAAAHRYRADGTLPPNMGRGAQGAAESKRIRAIATALDAQAGESPEDARIRQLALKGDVGAIAAMRKREVAVGANVKNFDFNADQVLQLSNKVDRTGVPLINAWMNAGRRSVAGNPDLAAFDVAVKTTVNEFAQIVSGTTSGGSTEGEKKKAEALLNAQQTPEQVLSVINQMRIESKNRMQSFANQRREAMPTNRATPPAGAAPAPSAGLPDTSAIDAELRRRAGGA
jgi:hypothetical protein